MALSHLVLQVSLCNSALRLKTQSALPLRVAITDRIKRDIYNQTFRVVRENGNTVSVSFDIPWGEYRAALSMKSGAVDCSGREYFAVISGINRTMKISLAEHPQDVPTPLLVFGSAPFAFSYVQPTVTIFDKGQACNAQVGQPLEANIDLQNDSDGYYATIFPSRELVEKQVVVAVRLTDSRGDYHYVRVPSKLMNFSSDWPSSATFDINENVIDYVADKPEDTLLCPQFHTIITH